MLTNDKDNNIFLPKEFLCEACLHEYSLEEDLRSCPHAYIAIENIKQQFKYGSYIEDVLNQEIIAASFRDENDTYIVLHNSTLNYIKSIIFKLIEKVSDNEE